MYFSNLYDKFSEFGQHHQVLFTVIVAFAIIIISWGIERILDVYVFPNQQLHGYLGAIIGGLAILWIVQHFILHVL